MDFMKRAKWKLQQYTARPETGRYLEILDWGYPERTGRQDSLKECSARRSYLSPNKRSERDDQAMVHVITLSP